MTIVPTPDPNKFCWGEKRDGVFYVRPHIHVKDAGNYMQCILFTTLDGLKAILSRLFPRYVPVNNLTIFRKKSDTTPVNSYHTVDDVSVESVRKVMESIPFPADFFTLKQKEDPDVMIRLVPEYSCRIPGTKIHKFMAVCKGNTREIKVTANRFCGGREQEGTDYQTAHVRYRDSDDNWCCTPFASMDELTAILPRYFSALAPEVEESIRDKKAAADERQRLLTTEINNRRMMREAIEDRASGMTSEIRRVIQKLRNDFGPDFSTHAAHAGSEFSPTDIAKYKIKEII